MARRYWLMKSEPDVYSIEDLERDGRTHWDGVRNHQAKNFMRDDMRVGDGVLFYHSNADPPGVAGLAEVVREGYPDFTAWDPKDPHHDPRSTKQNPVWFMVDVGFVERFDEPVALDEIKQEPALEQMYVRKRGMRLSVQPVEKRHFEKVVRLGRSSRRTGSKTTKKSLVKKRAPSKKKSTSKKATKKSGTKKKAAKKKTVKKPSAQEQAGKKRPAGGKRVK